MKTILLNQNKKAIVDDEDYHYLSRFEWCYSETNEIPRVVRTLLHKKGSMIIPLDDFIVPRPNGGGAKKIIHKNNDSLDFRKENLVFIGIEGVSHRGRKAKNKSSVYKGVTKNNSLTKDGRTRGKLWRAQIEKGIRPNSKTFIKSFDTEIEAAEWFNKKAKELYGEFAYQNKII